MVNAFARLFSGIQSLVALVWGIVLLFKGEFWMAVSLFFLSEVIMIGAYVSKIADKD